VNATLEAPANQISTLIPINDDESNDPQGISQRLPEYGTQLYLPKEQ